MKHNDMLTIASLLWIPFGTFHLAVDCGAYGGTNPDSPTTRRVEEAKWT
jgi:hypothetical protein